MTPRQEECLKLIQSHIVAHSRPPTVRWLVQRMGLRSTNGVADHLRRLERDGHIRIDPGARGVVLLGEHAVPGAGPTQSALWYIAGLESMPMPPGARAALRVLRAVFEGGGTVPATESSR